MPAAAIRRSGCRSPDASGRRRSSFSLLCLRDAARRERRRLLVIMPTRKRDRPGRSHKNGVRSSVIAGSAADLVVSDRGRRRQFVPPRGYEKENGSTELRPKRGNGLKAITTAASGNSEERSATGSARDGVRLSTSALAGEAARSIFSKKRTRRAADSRS